jgi:hypothetical protein
MPHEAAPPLSNLKERELTQSQSDLSHSSPNDGQGFAASTSTAVDGRGDASTLLEQVERDAFEIAQLEAARGMRPASTAVDGRGDASTLQEHALSAMRSTRTAWHGTRRPLRRTACEWHGPTASSTGYARHLKAFDRAYAARASTPVAAWISVSERLPKIGETVLCFFAPIVGMMVDGANFATATMSAPDHWHNPDDDEDDYVIPTLWQRIAAPSATTGGAE